MPKRSKAARKAPLIAVAAIVIAASLALLALPTPLSPQSPLNLLLSQLQLPLAATTALSPASFFVGSQADWSAGSSNFTTINSSGYLLLDVLSALYLTNTTSGQAAFNLGSLNQSYANSTGFLALLGTPAPAASFISSQASFLAGSLNQTHANSTGFLKLNWTDFSTNASHNKTGNWSSAVIDSTNASTQWLSLNWSSPWNASGQIRNDTFDTTSLVALWHFNNESIGEYNGSHFFNNATSLNATIGKNGSCTNCPNRGLGKFGSGVDFDGSTDRISLPTNSIRMGSGAYAISAWVNPFNLINFETTFGAAVVCTISVSTGNLGDYWFGVNDAGGVVFANWRSTATTGNLWTSDPAADGGIGVADYNWTHIAAVYNGTNSLLYVNGRRQPQTAVGNTGGGWTAQTLLGNGCNTAASNRYWWGSFDEVAIWNRSLSDHEVSTLYTLGASSLGLRVRSCDDSSCAGEQWQSPFGNGSLEFPSSLSVPGHPADNASRLSLLLHFNNQSVGERNGSHFEDLSGGGINGSCVSPSCPVNDTTSPFGRGLKFDGLDDNISFGDTTFTDGLANFTGSFWVKWANDQDGFILSKSLNGGDGWYFTSAFTTSDDLEFTVYNSTTGRSAIYNIGPGLPSGWHHVAGTYDARHIRLYLDGVLVAVTAHTGTMPNTADLLMIGDRTGSVAAFNGSVDEVVVFNRSLSAEEVRALYLHGTPNAFTDSPATLNANITPSNRYLQLFANLSTENASNTSWATGISVGLENGSLSLPYSSSGNYSTPLIDAQAAATWHSLNWSSPWNASGQLRNDTFNITGLVGLWHLNNESRGEYNGSHWQDNSTQGMNGSCAGTACPAVNASGRFKGAYEFDFSNDEIALQNSSAMTVFGGTQATLSAWVNPTGGFLASSTAGVIIGTGSNATFFDSLTIRKQGTSQVRLYVDGNAVSVTVPWVAGRWHHVVGVYDGTDSRIYFDGALMATSPISLTSLGIRWNGENLSIGHQDALPFGGRIDEVSVWNRSLSAQEVSQLYALGASKVGVQVRSCDDSSCAGEAWVGPDTTAQSSWNESPITLNTTFTPNNRYFQAKFNLTTENASNTSWLTSASALYSTQNTLYSHGNYSTAVFDSRQPTTPWDFLNWSSPWNASGQIRNDTFNTANLTLLLHLNNETVGEFNGSHFQDNSTNGYNGSCTSCPAFNASGKLKGAYTFDGTNDAISLPDLDFPVGGFAISLWYISGDTGAQSIIRKQPPSGTAGDIYLILNGDDLEAAVDDGAAQGFATAGKDWSDSRWHHAVLAVNSTHLELFGDGVSLERAAHDNSLTLNDNSWTIGNTTVQSQWFNGSIDEVAIWNRSLSAQEVSQLYALGASRVGVQARSCDDSSCAGEAWVGPDTTAQSSWNESPITLNTTFTPNNRYFQAKFNLTTENASTTSWVKSLAINHTNESGLGITSCRDITSPGYYFLSDNISSAGSCINITQSNVILDLNGYWISFGSQDNASYGVRFQNVTNITIKNGVINMSNHPTRTASGLNNLWLRNSSQVTIFNITAMATSLYSPLFVFTNFPLIANGSVNNTNISHSSFFQDSDGIDLPIVIALGDSQGRDNYTNWTFSDLNLSRRYGSSANLGSALELNAAEGRNWLVDSVSFDGSFFLPTNVTNVTFQNNTFPNAGSLGAITLGSPTRAHVQGLVLRDNRFGNASCAGAADANLTRLRFSSFNDVLIEGNNVSQPCGSSQAYRLLVLDEAASAAITAPSNNVTIRRNTLLGDGIIEAVRLAFDPAITGNRTAYDISENNITFTAANSTAAGNTASPTGIHLRCDSIPSGSALQNLRIANNTILSPALRAGTGIHIAGCTESGAQMGENITLMMNNISAAMHAYRLEGNATYTLINETVNRLAAVNHTSPYTDLWVLGSGGPRGPQLRVYNSSFNRTAAWSSGMAANLTDYWPVRVNVTNATFSPLSGIPLNLTNASYAINYTGAATDAQGLTPWLWAPNATYNGTPADANDGLDEPTHISQANWTPQTVSFDGNATWAANSTAFAASQNAQPVLILTGASAPDVTITEPADHQNFSISPRVYANATSPFLSHCNWYLRAEGAVLVDNANTTCNQAIFPVLNTTGQQNLTLVAYNMAGSRGTASVFFNFQTDPSDPVFISPTPANATYTRTASQTVNVSVARNITSATLEWNGFNYSMTLQNSTVANHTNSSIQPDQNVTYRVYVNDSFNLPNATEARVLVVDTAPPTSSILFPQNRTYKANNTEVNVTAACGDLNSANNATFSLNGGANQTLANGTVLGSQMGPNTLVISCWDRAGNVNWSSVSYTLDVAPYPLNLTAFPTAPLITGGAVNHTFLPLTNSTLVSATLFTNETGSWQSRSLNASQLFNSTLFGISYAPSANGHILWNIVVNSTDGFVNQSRVNQSYTYDTTAGNITLWQPSVNNTIRANSTIALNVTCKDNLASVCDVTAMRNGTAVQTITGVANGTTVNLSFPLLPGTNALWVNGTANSLATSNSSVIFVVVDNQTPSVTINSPIAAQNHSVDPVADVTITDPAPGTALTCAWSLNGAANQSFSCASDPTITGSSAGQNFLQVYATDEAGNVGGATVYYNFQTDPSDPVFIAPTPANATYTRTASQTVNVSVARNITSATLEWNGFNYSMTLQNSTLANHTNSSIQPDQNITYRVYVNDSFNLPNATEARVLVVDTANPAVSIQYPQNTTYSDNTSAINVTAATFDLNHAHNATFSLNGGANQTLANGTVLGSALGANTLQVCAWDRAGNLNCTSLVYTYLPPPPDNAPNATLMNSPPDGSLNATSPVSHLVRAWDDRVVSYGCLWSNESAWSETACNSSAIANDTPYLISNAWPDGHWKYALRAVDNGSNATFSPNYTITVDTTPGNATLHFPVENSSLRSNATIALNVSCIDNLATSCTVTAMRNGTAMQTLTIPNGTTTNLSFGLVEGVNALWANSSAHGLPGSNTSTIWVILDSQQPSVSCIYPVTRGNYSANTTLNCTASDPAPGTSLSCSYSLNGAANQSFACNTNVSIGGFFLGQNRLDVFALDQAANPGSATLWPNFQNDSSDPVFISPTPANASYVSSASQTINISVARNITSARLLWNGFNYSMTLENSTVASYTNASIPDGNVSYSVWINDSFNLPNATANRTLIVDATAPVANITAPLNGTYNQNQTLSFFASDANLNSVFFSINGGVNTTITANDTAIGLLNDVNVIELWATDSAGNIAGDREVITLSLAPPTAPATIQTFQLNLTRSGTSGSVAIPGAFLSPVAASSLGSKRVSNNTFSFISSLASPQVALASAAAAILVVSNTGSDHTIGLNFSASNRTAAQAFLAFTEGDQRAIQERMPLIASAAFLQAVSPSFSYGLGDRAPITYLLKYANLDLASNLTLGRGINTLEIVNNGLSSGRLQLTLDQQ